MIPRPCRDFAEPYSVAIDGVDFGPYVEVLLRPANGASVADRVVVMTDRDPQLAGNRAATLDALANGFGARPRLSVYSNAVTLEHELFAAGNEAVLREVFVSFTLGQVSAGINDIAALPANDRPSAFVGLLSAMEVRKGDFAQTLAERIVSGHAFAVPAYMRDAIVKISEA